MQVNSNNLFFPFSNPVSSDASSSLSSDPYLSQNNIPPASLPSDPLIPPPPINFCFDAGCNCGLPKKTPEMQNAAIADQFTSNVLYSKPNTYSSAAASSMEANNALATPGLTSNASSAAYSSDSFAYTASMPLSNFALPFGVPAPFLPPQFNQTVQASAPTPESIEQQNKLKLKLQEQRDLKKKQKKLEAQKKEELNKQKKKESKKRKDNSEGESSQVGKKKKDGNAHAANPNPDQFQPNSTYSYPYQYDPNYPYFFPNQFPQFFDPNFNPYANPHLSQPYFGAPFNPYSKPAYPQAPSLSAQSSHSSTDPIATEGESTQTETISSLFTDMVSNPNESSSAFDNFERNIPVPLQNKSFHGDLSPIHAPISSADGSFTLEPLDLPPPSHTHSRAMTPPPLPESFASTSASAPASSPLPPAPEKKKRRIIIRKATRKESSLASAIKNTPSSQSENKFNYLNEESLSARINARVRKRTSKLAELEGSEGEGNPPTLKTRISKIQKKISPIRRRQASKVAQTAIASQSHLNIPSQSAAPSQAPSNTPLPPILQPIESAQSPAAPLLSRPALNPSRVRQFNRVGARTMNVSRPATVPAPIPVSSILTVPQEVQPPKPKLIFDNLVIYESPEEFINKISLIMNSIPSEENTFEMRIKEFQSKLCTPLKLDDGTDSIKSGARIIMKKDDSKIVSFYCVFYEGPFSSEGLNEEAFQKFGVADKHYHIEFYEAQGNEKPNLRHPRIHMRVSKFHGELSWLQKGKSVSGTEVANFYKVYKDFLKIPMIIFDDAQIRMPHNRKGGTNYWLKANAIFDPEGKTWYQRLLNVDVINIENWLWKETGFSATQNREVYNNALHLVREYPVSELPKVLDGDNTRSVKSIAKKALNIQSLKESSHKIKDLYLKVSQLAKEAIKGPLEERVEEETNLSHLHDILLVLPKSSKRRALPYWKAIDVLIQTRIFCSGVADLNQVF